MLKETEERCARCEEKLYQDHNMKCYATFQYNPFRPKYKICPACYSELQCQIQQAQDDVRYRFYATIELERKDHKESKDVIQRTRDIYHKGPMLDWDEKINKID